MKYCILSGSAKKNGNTAALLEPFIKELHEAGSCGDLIWLYDKKIQPCIGCRACQNHWTVFGCPIADDGQEIFDSVFECDIVILATPIYSWYCTPPMKAMLDRLVYGMNKYYGKEKGPSLWAGKKLALLVTCGYPPEKGADLFEEGIKRYCKHSELEYMGMLAERDQGAKIEFLSEGKADNAKAFARKLAY